MPIDEEKLRDLSTRDFGNDIDIFVTKTCNNYRDYLRYYYKLNLELILVFVEMNIKLTIQRIWFPKKN